MVDKARSAHGPSFLRWAGSKRKSLALLSGAFSNQSCHYVEPFAGSAALFFSVRPSRGTLADLNGHLVNAMRHVRDDPKGLHRRLVAMPRNSEAYYKARCKFNELRPFGIQAAVLFVYLNRNCFNGLWRTNMNGVADGSLAAFRLRRVVGSAWSSASWPKDHISITELTSSSWTLKLCRAWALKRLMCLRRRSPLVCGKVGHCSWIFLRCHAR